MNPVRSVVGIVALALTLLAPAALAQLEEPKTPGLEVGVRYWVSTGSTERSHDASGFNCDFGSGFAFPCGKPTSVLNYDNLGAHTYELFARKNLESGWFAKGNLAVGFIPNGRLTDSDYVVPGGQFLAVETVSGLAGKLYYGTIDIGREMWKSGDSTYSLFAGYQRWNERLDAYGFSDSGKAFLQIIGETPGDNVPSISNDQTWDSARIGIEMRTVRGRTRFQAELAYIPYAKYKNEDTHWLRDDFGPNPVSIAKGRGYGWQAEFEIRRRVPDLWDLEFGVGYRYWVLTSATGTTTFPDGSQFPLMDLESARQGVTFSVGKYW